MKIPRATLLALMADPSSAFQPATRSGRDGGYWLSQCEGFAVDSPHGQVGVVESVVYAVNERRPAYLAVIGGRIRLHTALVPCGEVVSIDPSQMRLKLRARPARTPLRTTLVDRARRLSRRDGGSDNRGVAEADPTTKA